MVCRTYENWMFYIFGELQSCFRWFWKDKRHSYNGYADNSTEKASDDSALALKEVAPEASEVKDKPSAT